MSLRRNVVSSLTPVFVLASLFSPTAAQEDDPKQAVVEWDSPPGNLVRVLTPGISEHINDSVRSSCMKGERYAARTQAQAGRTQSKGARQYLEAWGRRRTTAQGLSHPAPRIVVTRRSRAGPIPLTFPRFGGPSLLRRRLTGTGKDTLGFLEQMETMGVPLSAAATLAVAHQALRVSTGCPAGLELILAIFT